MTKIKPDIRRQWRVRMSLRSKSGERARLSVHRTNKNIYAQLIDDVKNVTLTSASTLTKGSKEKKNTTMDTAKKVGKLLGEQALKLGIKDVVFDRGKFLYHGKVKALAEGAREAGLNF